MVNQIVFLYPVVFFALLVVIILVAGYRWFFWRPVMFSHSLTSILVKSFGVRGRHMSEYVLFALRSLSLILMGFLISRPQFVDPNSKIKVEGVDIALVLDVSGSMTLFDDQKSRTTRIDIAKKEAINFINKRDNDPIGLVLFGNFAVSRCPLTLDKKILTSIVDKVEIGEVDEKGTALFLGMMTALNRLKRSKAKSKVMILLTDGRPSDNRVDPKVVIDIANKLGVKVYTVGIGSEDGGFFEHPFFGLQQSKGSFNQELLKYLATETGGQFFSAKSASGMREVYNKIDQLEKTEHETSIFAHQYDWFFWPLVMICLLILFEFLLSRFIWFGVN